MCLASTHCRVLNRQMNEPEFLRLHLVIDYEKLFAELSGSWLQSSLRGGVLDCSQSRWINGQRDRPKIDFYHGFEPLHNESDPNIGEMFYAVVIPDSITSTRPVRLVPCSAKLHAASFGHLEIDTQYMPANGPSNHRRRGNVPRTWNSAIRAASPSAAVVFQMSYIPDTGVENMRAVSEWLRRRRVTPAQRALVLHYRAGRLPSRWHEPLSPSSIHE